MGLRPNVHRSLDFTRIAGAIERRHTILDNPGFCTCCGHEQDGCEPDARQYECESCGELAVYAPEELLMEGKYY